MMKPRQTPQTRSPLKKLLQKTLIVTLVAAITIMLGLFGPELLGAWTKPALGLLIVGGLAALAATR
jgi:asparagine N-glycosylation enzyme membrane subunit Stt3